MSASDAGRTRTPSPVHPQGHFPESCGCDYCTHPDWCGGPAHEHLDEAPLWPCPDTLAANGMTTAKQFHEAEAASWEEWAREAHPEWFEDVPAPTAGARGQTPRSPSTT